MNECCERRDRSASERSAKVEEREARDVVEGKGGVWREEEEENDEDNDDDEEEDEDDDEEEEEEEEESRTECVLRREASGREFMRSIASPTILPQM